MTADGITALAAPEHTGAPADRIHRGSEPAFYYQGTRVSDAELYRGKNPLRTSTESYVSSPTSCTMTISRIRTPGETAAGLQSMEKGPDAVRRDFLRLPQHADRRIYRVSE